ncbi:hypothetical protein BO79DRAFT_191966 [Aspergillus costaricaensis CBS 115574]|uniref:Uncharacterized protein n=1 Tax=Aspergillus costaricaensis CBS 115574 TaxID=1448317 RepID=A0ACD1III1_9EURO|nr:hypothetical protein BO79DRAFT_191966 [Aspergillus costaricaensis CBS 115574]RAK90418.1 hypothetical protein BO79DRAFT_191966 [Aspergillus costaricaensis CBS 115574]
MSLSPTTPRSSRPITASRPRRVRKPISCAPCRDSKLQYDQQHPCATCRRRGLVPSYYYPNTSRTPVRAGYGHEALQDFDTSHLLSPSQVLIPDNQAEPEGPASKRHARWEAIFKREVNPLCDSPVAVSSEQGQITDKKVCFPFQFGPSISKEHILATLPPRESCDFLISQYFLQLSPLFHVLHGPTFQRQYNAFLKNLSSADLAWVALLFTVLSMVLNTLKDDDVPLAERLWLQQLQYTSLQGIASQYRKSAMLCLSEDNFLIQHSLNTLEALLILLYRISHNDGVEQTWALLVGTAHNIGITLRCNLKAKPLAMSYIEFERRRRCWAGICLLHTYQAILFRDINISFLLDKQEHGLFPADVNDSDIHDNFIRQPSSQPTQMSMIMFKLRLFKLSSRICQRLSTPLDEHTLIQFNTEIAAEQAQWDKKFLIDGKPSILDIASYAHWCILQQYAHQLYLLIHRSFCTRQSPSNPERQIDSQLKCISSGAALLEIQRLFFEVPRLRHYRWYVYGMTSFCALHGAVALASCLLMQSAEFDSSVYHEAFDAAVVRIEKIKRRSPICVKALPILKGLQNKLQPEKAPVLTTAIGIETNTVPEEWAETLPWLSMDMIN